MKDEFVKNIGIWGQLHYNYLKKSSPTVINVKITFNRILAVILILGTTNAAFVIKAS